MKTKLINIAILILMVSAAAGVFACVANGQTSTIGAMPDTVHSLEVTIPFTVDPPNGELVGIYWRIAGETGWMYAGAGTGSITWTAPIDDTEYQFYSQVDPEPYREVPSASVYVCSNCGVEDCPDCPPPSLLTATQVIAEFNPTLISIETPAIEWYWTHPTTGSEVVSYNMHFESIGQAGDTIRVTFPGLTQMDSLYGYGQTPYPLVGEQQRVRVEGVDDQGRTGPPSIWAAWFGDDGPPGEPGLPLKHLILVTP